MTGVVPRPDGPLTPEEEQVKRLSRSEVDEIDKALLAHVDNHWQKVAKVVGMTMMETPERIIGIPDKYYASRVRALVEQGTLQSQGNLENMGFSEVRLASP